MMCKDGFVRNYAVDATVCTCGVPEEYVHAAKSPDASIMENVFAQMVSDSKDYPVPTAVQELTDMLTTIWEKLPMPYLQKLSDSMPRRFEAIVKKNGHITKY